MSSFLATVPAASEWEISRAPVLYLSSAHVQELNEITSHLKNKDPKGIKGANSLNESSSVASFSISFTYVFKTRKLKWS